MKKSALVCIFMYITYALTFSIIAELIINNYGKKSTELVICCIFFSVLLIAIVTNKQLNNFIENLDKSSGGK